MWIIQEVAVAKEVTITFGTKDVEFFRFAEFNCLIDLLDDKDFSTEYPSLHSVGIFSRNPARKIWLQRFLWQRDVPRNLLRLLPEFRFHEVTDFRDRVFALRGLVRDGIDLTVDYTISREELVKQVLLQEYRSGSDQIMSLSLILGWGRLLADLFGVAYDGEALKQYIDADWSRVLDWSAVEYKDFLT